jgi:hypothetical protein
MTRRRSRPHLQAEAARVRCYRAARAEDPAFKERNHLRKLFRDYGLEPEQAKALFNAFYERCAICGEPETAISRTGRPQSIAVDHDHATMKIRGVLCARHNRALGAFQDDPEMLRRAAKYLENPPWQGLDGEAA